MPAQLSWYAGNETGITRQEALEYSVQLAAEALNGREDAVRASELYQELRPKLEELIECSITDGQWRSVTATLARALVDAGVMRRATGLGYRYYWAGAAVETESELDSLAVYTPEDEDEDEDEDITEDAPIPASDIPSYIAPPTPKRTMRYVEYDDLNVKITNTVGVEREILIKGTATNGEILEVLRAILT